MRKSRVFILVFTISILVLAALCVGLVFAFLPKKAKEEAPSYAPSISSSPSQSPTISSAPTRTKTYTLLKTFELVGERNGDAFGDSISMSADGCILAVGASSGELDNSGQLNIGWVKVYKRNEDNEMIPYGLPIYGAQNPGALFGYNLSLSPDGSTLAIAIQNAERDDGECCNYGRVVVYRSLSLSYDGSILAIGGNRQVKVFVFNILKKEWETFGEAFVESISSRHFVSLSGDGLLLAIGTSELSLTTSRVKVYKYSGGGFFGQWIEYTNEEMFTSDDGISSLCLSSGGNIVAFVHGRNLEVYEHSHKENGLESEGNWVRIGQITFEIQEEISSSSLTLLADGRKLVVGIIGVSFDEMQVYTFNNNEWNLTNQEIGKVDSLSTVQEEFGKSVAISYDGNYIATGATEDSGPGYVWLYDFIIE